MSQIAYIWSSVQFIPDFCPRKIVKNVKKNGWSWASGRLGVENIPNLVKSSFWQSTFLQFLRFLHFFLGGNYKWRKTRMPVNQPREYTTTVCFPLFFMLKLGQQSLYILLLSKQIRNIPDRGENLYAADCALHIFLPYKLSRQLLKRKCW